MRKLVAIGVWTAGFASALAAPTVVDTDTTLSGPYDAAAAYSVRNGATLTVKSRLAGDADAVLPQTLQVKATFWLDANKNLVTDADGHIVEWLDARETDVAAPQNATKAIVQKQGNYPSDDLTVSTFPDGKKYVDFGEYNENRWMMFVRTDGGDSYICGRKRLAFRAAVGYIGFGKTAGFVFGDVADPTKAGWIDVSGDNARCILHKGQGGSGNDNIYGNNTYAKIGETWKDGSLVNPFATTHTRNGWELFAQNGPYQVQASGVETPFASTLFNCGNIKAESVASGNKLQNRQGGGKVAEIIYFNDVLTQAEREQVEAYLRHKWKDGGNVGEINAADGTKVVADTDESVWAKDVSGAGALEKNGANGTLRVVRNGRLAAGPLTLNAGKVVDWEKRVHRPLVVLGGKRVQANATTVNVAAEGAADVATLAATSDGLPLAFGGAAEGVTRVRVEKANLTLQPLALPSEAPVDPRQSVGQNLIRNGGFEALKVTAGSGWVQSVANVAPWVASSKKTAGNIGASLKTVSTWLGGPNDGYSETTGCPEGDQFALLQINSADGLCGISQEIDVPETGVYRFSTWARGRYRYNSVAASVVVMKVFADDTEVLRRRLGPQFKRTTALERAADACTFQCVAAEFVLTKGKHTIHVLSQNPSGAAAGQLDRALDIDDVRLELVKPGDFVPVVNAGFDWWDNNVAGDSTLLSAGVFGWGSGYNYGWSFGSNSSAGINSGIARNIGAWFEDASDDPTGRNGQVMAIQRTGVAAQQIAFPRAGLMRVQFRYCNRWGSNRAQGHQVVALVGDQQAVAATVTDATMRLAEGLIEVAEPGVKTLTIKVVANDSNDRTAIVDDVTLEYVPMTLTGDATAEADGADSSEVVLKGQATASQTFTTSEAGPQLLTFRLRGKPLNPWGAGGTYQSHVSYTHLMSVAVDGTFIGQLYAQESERQVFELRTPYLAAGEHTVVFAGDANQENDACESRLSDVTLTPLAVGEMPDVSNVGIYLMDDKAKLNLDFSGTVNLKKFCVNGKLMHGTLSKDNCSAITGEGSVFVGTPGTAIVFR